MADELDPTERDPSMVVRSVAALLSQDETVAQSFLLAALYTRAIQQGVSPTHVADELFKAVPSSGSWPTLRASLLAAAEESGGA